MVLVFEKGRDGEPMLDRRRSRLAIEVEPTSFEPIFRQWQVVKPRRSGPSQWGVA
jgi:hypothetical protein